MTDHETILAYAEEIDWALVPVYVTLSFLVAWVGVLSVLFFESEGVSNATMVDLAIAIQALMILLILIPFGAPLLRVVGRRW
jgi:hypothetical protein